MGLLVKAVLVLEGEWKGQARRKADFNSLGRGEGPAPRKATRTKMPVVKLCCGQQSFFTSPSPP